MSDEWKLVRSDALYPPDEPASGKPDGAGKPGRDVIVYWRGSATDLATDLAALLTVEQLQELVGELAIRWREKAQKRRGGGP